ncbi:MAG TPA: sigma factor [Gemmataceae bacterium]|nr:sigma factor [Gemmataceae bacterium]
MNHPSNKAAATLPVVPCAIYRRKSTRPSKQPSPTDPASVWNQSQRILFAVAHKVRRAIHLKLEGHGHAEVEPQELVHDAFIAVMEALPRFQPATAQFTTFVYGLARRRMWLVARAGFYGLSPEQMHRLDTAKGTPRYHRNDSCLRLTPASTADPQERLSVRRVATIRHRLSRADRRLLDLYLQEGGNYAAVARRLGCVPESVRGRYSCLFRRIRAAI